MTRSNAGKLIPAWQTVGGQVTPGYRTAAPGWMFTQGDRETVEAERRRKSDGPSGRADAPARQRPGAERPASGGGGYTGGGGGGGGGTTGGGSRSPLRLPLWLIVVLILLFVGFQLFSGGGGDQGNQDTTGTDNYALTEEALSYALTQDAAGQAQVEEPTLPPAVETTPLPTRTPRPAQAAGTKGGTWTVLLYQDADDQVLEQDIYVDLNEAERAGSTDRVNILAQLDRYRGAFQGDGDWVGARRYFVTRDNDLSRVRSKMLTDLGNINMSDPNTLIDFVTWGIKTYPADHYVLILSDHGMGWPGGWSDSSPARNKDTSIPLVRTAGNQLYLMELDQALGKIRQQTGVDAFELIGMDACLMGHLEVFDMLAPHARYAVASQETEPALGWAYTNFLQGLTANPDMGGADLAKLIVKGYIADDQRVVDDQARADFLRQGSPMGGLFGGVNDIGAARLAQQLERSVTITAADLSQLPGLMDSVNNLAYALQSEDQSFVARARTYAQSFTNIFGEKLPPPYIDLGNFVQILASESGSAKVQQVAGGVEQAIRQVVIAEKHGSDKPGATGVSIYFPNSQLYRSPEAGPASYTAIAKRFAQDSLWDDYLAFHYTKRPFEPVGSTAVIPGSGVSVRSPALGQISVSQVQLSSNETAPDQPVTMTATLSGRNIGYVYLFIGYYDTSANSVLVLDTDYLESPKTREVNGVYYPQWSNNETFDLKFDWNPTVFGISDGKKTVTALLKPERYGATAADAVYTVDGTYTFASSGETRKARLYFRDGKLRQVFGFTASDSASAPREIIPARGDTFTLQEEWLDRASDGSLTPATVDGETLTFGSDMFTWKELYAAPGEYVIGFMVSDLDGNDKQTYAQVTVK